MKMYTVHDAAAQAFLPPFTSPSERDALSSFELAANDPQSNISKYPADFTLIQIAEFDERTGVLVKLADPIQLGSAAKYKKQQTVVTNINDHL
ncbi:MAG: nonstructural protein [Wigfec virus K19_177]|nr:MAG: nonstructural protein [Wigfec virus K19_177]